ncbi:MAG: DUF3579 domain-containing protein [Betaproteobacteria bacterium]|nr:DUF3579 domain-containing protein [Betaproteobacteria bacterium]
MPSDPQDFLIEGTTLAGSRFRPSDWAERVCGMLSVFGADQRLTYSHYVKPIAVDGVKCVVVSRKLLDIEPGAYHYLKGFARDNELRVRAAPIELLGKLDASGQ